MSEVSPIGTTDVGRIQRGRVDHDRPGTERPDAPTRRGDDRVEVSEVARLLSKLREVPPIRQELVDDVRSRIDEGSYDTPERLEAAVTAALEDIEIG